jgi:hypothetical protein
MAGHEIFREHSQGHRVWVEITQSAHEHGGPGWEFGTCLWSPARNSSGDDSYAIMREPIPGDRVIHFYEDTWPDAEKEIRLCGVSRVTSGYSETSVEPPNPGKWAGRDSYYRIELEEFTQLEPPLPAKQLRATYAVEILAELIEDKPKHYPFVKYRNEVRTTQGGYLTRATPRLLRLISAALGIQEAAADASAEPAIEHRGFAEGQRLRREIFFFSRNPGLTRAAKVHYGLCCMACGFDFEAVYGMLGRGYIECHHLDPLSERPEADWSEKLTTCIEQVVVLCANCHRMAHRKRPALSIEELRGLVTTPSRV